MFFPLGYAEALATTGADDALVTALDRGVAAPEAGRWAVVGVTPMIGQNDEADEVFGLSDAQQLVTFADQNHLGELAFWAVTRDQACANGGGLSTCTEITQSPYQFSSLFAAFTG